MRRVFALVALAAVGCYASPEREIPEAPQTRRPAPTLPDIDYEVRWLALGKEEGAALAQSILRERFERVAVDSGAFASIRSGTGLPNHLVVKVENYGSIPKAAMLGVISGLSLFLIPVKAVDRYRLTGTLTVEGAEPRTVTNDDAVGTWIWLPFGMVIAFTPSTRSVVEASLDNQIWTMIEDLEQPQR